MTSDQSSDMSIIFLLILLLIPLKPGSQQFNPFGGEVNFLVTGLNRSGPVLSLLHFMVETRKKKYFLTVGK